MNKRDLFWGRTRVGRCLHVCEWLLGVEDEEEAETLCWGSAAKPVSGTGPWADLPKCSKCLKKVMGREPVQWLE